ncbi:hypothetical protein GQ53DRAFT_46945 [Thozetella sp. PMI_491]|nr:hypothetical protein GQ53DRAFT_93495 [Thozetella sp. PMI_491]KAH8879101.1 hypothetical protein GQ53DRAFT_46945 [Thozetella sp. PMI_491]
MQEAHEGPTKPSRRGGGYRARSLEVGLVMEGMHFFGGSREPALAIISESKGDRYSWSPDGERPDRQVASSSMGGAQWALLADRDFLGGTP